MAKMRKEKDDENGRAQGLMGFGSDGSRDRERRCLLGAKDGRPD
jgi:hypothetical protein